MQKYLENATFEQLIVEFKGQQVVRNLVRNSLHGFDNQNSENQRQISNFFDKNTCRRFTHFFDSSDMLLTNGDQLIRVCSIA